MSLILGSVEGLNLDTPEAADAGELEQANLISIPDISKHVSEAIKAVYGEIAQSGYDFAIKESIMPDDYNKALRLIAGVTSNVVLWNEPEDPLLVPRENREAFDDAGAFLAGITSILEE